MDLITVIINVYNGEKYINKCLDSIINQTYKKLEILVINDGSTDNTLSILNSYNDKRIRIITTENKGLSLSRNIGIDNAKGEYLYFIDVDDFIELDTIEYLYKLIKENNYDLAICESHDIYNYDFKLKNKKEKVKEKKGIELLKKILLSNDNSGTIWNKLIKKSIFDDIRFEDRIINDVVVVYKIALKIDKYIYSNQIKYYYYRHNDSIMGKHKPERSIDLYKASLERYNNIEKYYPNLLENKICILVVTSMIYYYDNKIVDEYLEKVKAKELYDNFFTFKIIFYKLKLKEKIILFMYRISPNKSRNLLKKYSKIKKKLKNVK